MEKEFGTRNGRGCLGSRTIWGSSTPSGAGLFFAMVLLGGYYFQSADSHKFHGGQLAQWLNHGNGLLNHRDAKSEHKISSTTVSRLSPRWEFIAGDDITATPAISEGVVYFPTWGGNLYALKQDTGELVWMKNLTETLVIIAGNQVPNGTFTVRARATPTIHGDTLLIGYAGPCLQLAINKTTGGVLWATLLDAMEYALITMSGQAFEGYYYIGTSSADNAFPDTCCTFQGAFLKLNMSTGEVVWRVPMLPYNGGKVGGYSGASVWGSTPPIDVKTRTVFIGTGQMYTAPANVTACELAWRNTTNRPYPDPCLVYDNHQESILSINIDSGEIKWATKLGAYDTYLVVCGTGPNAIPCPLIPGPDADFGEAPMLLSVPDPAGAEGNKTKDIVVCGQKNGFVWGLDAVNGSILWGVPAGPGGALGGASWGMATNGESLVFTNIINNNNENWTLHPSSEVVNTSGWVALQAATGEFAWSVANTFGELAISPVTHANGVVLAGSTAKAGAVVGLDANNGKVLWNSTISHGSISGGFSVADGCAFIGTGLSLTTASVFPYENSTSNSLVAFCVG